MDDSRKKYWKEFLTKEQIQFIQAHLTEDINLIGQLGQIPAPTRAEEQRAAFIKGWLEEQGAQGVYIDEAKNVVYPYHCEEGGPIVVVAAHMDIVFPDMQTLPLRLEDGKMYAPGIGDDTACLVQLLMTAKYVTQEAFTPACGILFVADSCEEGLGNSDGCRRILEAYEGRVKKFISFDRYMGQLTSRAVGSYRYRITVRTEGGHSYQDFGNANAIYYLSSMIQTLYARKAPSQAKTTWNVGRIEGGTTVNSIAQEASMLYEFRSESLECLQEMEEFFQFVMATYRRMGIELEAERVGLRPCALGVDEKKLKKLTQKNKQIVETVTGKPCEVDASSTDANIALSMGIPANTIGTIRGQGAHTREEWIDLASVEEGFAITMAVITGL